MLNLKRKLIAGILVGVVSISSLFTVYAVNEDKENVSKAVEETQEIKNVIVLIADGMSVDGVTLTRWYNSLDESTGKVDTQKTLSFDEMASGLVRTYWQANGEVGAITDSAPAGTALATGTKTMDKFIGVNDKKMPLATILETSKNIGKSTGLISTSQIMHATPAAYSSHYPDRSKEDIIAEQQVYNNIDVVLGGGYTRLNQREDKENLVSILNKQGYQYITDKKDLGGIKNKTWGMFAESDLAYEMDKEELKPTQPSLADMTKKGIETLSKDEDGFFLMVESSKVDWAAHTNDPIGMISEINAFEKSVETALEYAKKSNDTMVIAITDHGNSGITIGNKDTDKTYSKEGIKKFIEPLKKAKLTGEGIATKLREENADITKVMAEFGGINDITSEEMTLLTNAIKDESQNIQEIYGKMMAKRAFLGFTTNGHTGEDITLYSYLPNNGRINGTINNIDIPKKIAKTWGIDLEKATEEYYNNARENFEKIGAKVEITGVDKKNIQMIVTKDKDRIKIPENKNYVTFNGKKVKLNSVNVNVENTFYVNEKVIDLIK